jgi:hypothetical protein
MTAAANRLGTLRGNAALALIAFALMLRVLIPAGFMPVAGQGFAITLCTSMGSVSAWVDDQGNVHKGKKSPDKQDKAPCPFAAFAAAIALPGFADLPIVAAAADRLPLLFHAVSVGRGLAAPPPPSTGPPATP